ncbi:MAG TPA: DUF1385 domain-containing protein [Candidatus Limnocylindrales bacterium]|nr:DUF1385 domain-containing protein [Candidatus Limnocylindrales bacterium]
MASDSAPTYGGQALVEGVLIRTSDRWAIALRQPDGQLYQADGPIAAPGGAWTLPFLRGLRALGVQLRIGTRALLDSSVMADHGEIRPLPALGLALTLVVSLVIALSIFTALPLLLTGREPAAEATLLQRLSEGVIKAGFLALYVIGVTRVPRYGRIFSYHGAEHMAISCAEDGQPLTVDNVSRYSPAHPRCGTGFLVILAGVDTFVLAVLPRFGELADLALRIGFVPFTAAVAYELLRWGSRQRGIGFALNRFGLFSQRLTTARPDREQIEVAISAMQLCRSAGRAAEAPIAARTITALQ